MTRIKSKKFLVSKNSVFVLLVMVCGFSPAQAERTFSYSYNSQGLIETLDGARTDVVDITRFEYDAQGNRTKIINALGQTVHITEHDPSGHPLRVIDPNGAITELEYDRRGRLISQTVERNSTQLSYDATGNLKQITQATGQTFTYDYDEAHRLTGYRDALGNQVSYTLDAAGNRLSEILSDSNHTLTKRHEFVYDKLGRLINDISASEQLSTLAYDNNNNQTYLTDAKGNPTQFSFDALNRLTKTTDANNGQSHYQYDSRDNLVSVIDPNGHSTSYRYDEFNNLIEQNSPDTGITSYTTDSAGNRLSQTNAKGITTRYTYDALNRLTSVNYPDHSQDVTYQYDENAAGQNGIGRLTTQRDASGTTEYAYDKQGNLTIVTTSRETESQETETLNLEYAYNKADQLTQITYPDQRTVDYQYDITGRLSVITTTNKQGEKQTILTDIRYQPFGPVISQTWGNELTSQHVMDLDYRQMQLDTPTILTRQYEYDENNNIIDINDELVINNSQHFSYDILDRLTQAHNQNYGDIDYAYDLTHNRLQKTIVKNNQTEQQDYHYQQDNNQITRVKSKDYQYDETGNIIDNGRYQFDYGDDNRLNSVSQNGQLIARYRYNAQGQRTRKTVNQITTQYYYNQVGQLLAEMTQGNQRQLRLLQEQAQQLQQEIEQTQLQKQHQENQQTRQQTLIQTLEQNQTNAQTAKRKADQQAKRQSSQLRHSQFIIRILTRLQQRYDYNWWKTLFQSWININQQREQKLQQQLNLTQQKIVEQQDIIDTLGQSLEQAHHDLANTQQHILQLQQQRQDQQQQLEKIEQQIRGIEQQGSSAETHIKNYFYAQGRLIAIAKEEALYYVHTDHLATPQIITDQTQQIVWQASYTPFGKTTVQKQTITNNIRFPGQYYDEETGLHYNYFRYYDPEIGRYITSDPIGLAGGMNTYAYVGGNPLKYSDPRGLAVLQAISWCGTNPACTAAMVQSARKVAQACMIGATAVAGGFWGVLNGAIDSPQNETDSDRKEWIYGPEKDSKVNSDGSTNNNTWTTPDDYSSPGEAQDYLDPFKPMNGRRPVTIPKGTPIQEGTTPGGEGLYNGSGGANETLIPNGLPSGAAGSWKPL